MTVEQLIRELEEMITQEAISSLAELRVYTGKGTFSNIEIDKHYSTRNVLYIDVN